MFQGYTQGAVDFLWNLKFNNERPWFQAHKEEFLALVDRPTRELAEQLRDEMTQAFPKLGLELKVSRIYRDARRLFGRGPYKDHLWFSLRRPGERDSAIPCFWFEIAPDHYGYGMGCWDMPPSLLARLRARIDQAPGPLESLARRLNRHPRLRLDGPDYKRPKGEASALLSPWYNKKSFSLGYEGPHDSLLWSHALADRLLEDFAFLLPYYRYMLSLEGDPAPSSP